MINEDINGGSITISKNGIYLSATTDKGRMVQFKFLKLPELRAIGVGNMCSDGEGILFLDYDDITIADLKRQLLFLHNAHALSHFLILRTRKDSYHAICFEKFRLSKLQEIIDDSLCDYSYKRMPRKMDKGWILRLAPKVDMDGNKVSHKPEFLSLESFAKPMRRLSRAHIELFASVYPEMGESIADALPEEIWDGLTTVNLIRYGTSSSSLMAELGLDGFIKSKRITITWDNDGSQSEV